MRIRRTGKTWSGFAGPIAKTGEFAVVKPAVQLESSWTAATCCDGTDFGAAFLAAGFLAAGVFFVATPSALALEVFLALTTLKMHVGYKRKLFD